MKAVIFIVLVLIPQLNLFHFFPFQEGHLNELKNKDVSFLADWVDPHMKIQARQVRLGNMLQPFGQGQWKDC